MYENSVRVSATLADGTLVERTVEIERIGNKRFVVKETRASILSAASSVLDMLEASGLPSQITD